MNTGGCSGSQRYRAADFTIEFTHRLHRRAHRLFNPIAVGQQGDTGRRRFNSPPGALKQPGL